MKTVIIKMDDLMPGAGGVKAYPLQLYFDKGQANWLTQPVVEASIPEDLSIANPPHDPIRNAAVNGLQIRDDFLKESGAGPRLEIWGSYLYQLLLQNPLGQEWKQLRAQYRAGQAEGLRTILDIRPDTLRWLPWELLFEAPLPLFFDAADPFARGELDANLQTKPFTWPIHVLIVVGSKPNDPAVNAEIELDAIQRAFIKSPVPIDWYVSCRPNRNELSQLIASFKPQIFHFIGHGKTLNNYSFLELTDKNGGAAEEWTVQDISIDLLNWRPRFVFVNACRTSSAAAQENSWDIARAFTNAHVPAVAGMQADIKGDAAAAFSGQLYQALVNGQHVDCALAEARAAVRNLKTVTVKKRDWAVATLYLQQLPEQILEIKPPIDEKTGKRFRSDVTLRKTMDFVGRLTQRRSLWYGVDQIEERDANFSSLCIVVGSEQIGKTALVQASMKVCALRNRRISYVDIGYQTTKDFVELLNIIRKGDPDSSNIICAPLPESSSFMDLDQKYGQLLAQPDAATVLAGDSHLCEQVFSLYRSALVDIATAMPLILVLDHLSVEWETFNSILIPRLLLPIAQNQLPNCRLILVCTATEFEKRLPQELKNQASVIDVAAWRPDKYVPLARQICLYNDIELDTEVEDIIESLAKRVKSDWGPTRLRNIIKVLKP